MNVAGISTTPAAAPVPVVTPVTPATPGSTNPREHERHSEERHRAQQRRAAVEAPKLKPLSTTEVRVMLGMAPPEALHDEAEKSLRRGGFDSYA
jgi:hypothetical protein